MTHNGKRIIIYRVHFPEEIRENVRGMVSEDTDKYYILINSTLSEEEQQHALGHELAHIFLGHVDQGRANDPEAEAEADHEAEKYYRLWRRSA